MQDHVPVHHPGGVRQVHESASFSVNFAESHIHCSILIPIPTLLQHHKQSKTTRRHSSKNYRLHWLCSAAPQSFSPHTLDYPPTGAAPLIGSWHADVRFIRHPRLRRVRLSVLSRPDLIIDVCVSTLPLGISLSSLPGALPLCSISALSLSALSSPPTA